MDRKIYRGFRPTWKVSGLQVRFGYSDACEDDPVRRSVNLWTSPNGLLVRPMQSERSHPRSGSRSEVCGERSAVAATAVSGGVGVGPMSDGLGLVSGRHRPEERRPPMPLPGTEAESR